MICKKELYVVICDDCAEMLDLQGEGGYTVFETEQKAIEHAGLDGWQISETMCLCFDCTEMRKIKSQISQTEVNDG